MNYYIFTTVDADHISNSRKTPAIDIVVARLNKSVWPIYKGTKNRDKLTNGDMCLFYIGGYKKTSRHIIAKATIESISQSTQSVDHEDILTGVPYKHILLETVVFFESPISILSNLQQLSFIPKDSRYWGTTLQGGCRKISKNDFEILSRT